jgi:hypothetical protein
MISPLVPQGLELMGRYEKKQLNLQTEIPAILIQRLIIFVPVNYLRACAV